MTEPERIDELRDLGEYIREKLDRRGLRTIWDRPLTEACVRDDGARIQTEVIEPMERFVAVWKRSPVGPWRPAPTLRAKLFERLRKSGNCRDGACRECTQATDDILALVLEGR